MNQALAVQSGKPMITKEFPKWPIWNDQEINRVEQAVRSGVWGVEGPLLTEYANRFADLQHAKYALPVCNGSIAIDLALEVLDLRAGDEVLVPDYTFMATAVAPIRRGMKPVLVDVDRNTFNIDPECIINAITNRTRAIIPVHFGGLPCDMEAIMTIAERYGLLVIEDCAHAHGAHLDEQYVGNWGSVGTFSHQSSKTLCAGEGGTVVTNSTRLFTLMKSIYNAGRHGCEVDYNHYRCGTNYRMTELQAGLLLAQLDRFEALAEKRERGGALLNNLLSEIDGVRPQVRTANLGRHGYYLFTFILEDDIDRDSFKNTLRAEGVPVEDEYPALHSLECLKKKDVTRGHFPVSQMLEDRSVWISHNALLADEDQITLIADAVRKVINHKNVL